MWSPEHRTNLIRLGGFISLILALIIMIGLGAIAAINPTRQQPAYAQDGTPTPTPLPPPLVKLNEDIIKRATVFIMQTYNSQTNPVISCVSSGTLVSADGIILTNAHSALASESCPSDRIVIAVTVRLDEPPVPTYTAEVLDANQGFDLAVLRITGYLDGRIIEPGALQLPFVELGDSASVQLDETITVVGYPGFGSDPVASTRGTINGFTAEAGIGARAWLRTQATIPGTMTGGGVYDRAGKLIAIPTIAPARTGGEAIDCRVIQDTNQDGRADSSDNCVPIGGFITALRPSRLARGLVRAATLGIHQGETSIDRTQSQVSGEPIFTNLFFTTRINDAGVPANAISTAPSGTTSLYLFFDYNNMQDGMIYELRVTVNDNPNPIYSLPPVTWSGGTRGQWYIGSSEIGWENGLYFFRLFIEGHEAASRSIRIGGGPDNSPQFSDIVFGLAGPDSGLVGTNYVLPEGSAIQAQFIYRDMQPGLSWTQIWYYEGSELTRSTETWQGDAQGTYMINTSADFIPGQYRLQLYINNVLSAQADFVIAGGAEQNQASIFSDFQFASDVVNNAPGGTIRNDFQAGLNTLYTFFDWRLMAPGTMWTRRWLVDDETLFEITEPWVAPPDGENFYVSLFGDGTLPDATYTLEISIANVVLHRVSAEIGLGQLPVEVFASAEGVQMTGRITNAETGEGIAGAMFIVLESEYSVEDFLWQANQVLGVSLADREGRYQVPVLLERGPLDAPVLYSILVRAEGYLPVSADGIAVDESTASPIVIDVELSHN